MPGAGRGTIVAVMTETTTAPQGPPSGPHPSLLYRDPDNSMFAGVCTAVGRYTGTDPVIWRIVTVVLTVFGGAGVLLYVLGWLLIPKAGAPMSIAEGALRRRQPLTPAVVLAIVLVALFVFSGVHRGHGLWALAVIAGVAYLVHRDREGRPLVPSYAGAAGPPADVAGPADAPQAAPAPPPPAASWPTDPAAWAGPATAPAWKVPPAEPRPPRSRLGVVTLSVAALVSGVLVLADQAGADGVTPARTLAVALLVVGGGLVVGTWLGRARWLFLVGILLAVALVGTAATDDASDTFRGGLGERTWVVSPGATDASYRLGIGEATLDLRDLPATGRHVAVDAHIGAGHLIVLVPDDVPIRLHATARVGDITEFGRSIANGGERMERTLTYGPPGDPQVEVDAAVTAGQVEVRHG